MITKEQFKRYEDVRLSGITNMFDTTTVTKLTGLNKEDIIDIMRNYGSYKSEFLDVNKMDD